jgi:hypothetical protein
MRIESGLPVQQCSGGPAHPREHVHGDKRAGGGGRVTDDGWHSRRREVMGFGRTGKAAL